MKLTRAFNTSLERFSGVYLWVVFMVVFSLWTPHEFFTISTFHSVATAQAVQGMLAIAVLIPLVAGQFDLSVGANANLAGIVAIVAQTMWHWPLLWSVVIAVVIGFGVGFINGFVVVKLRVNSFIATLGMGSVLAAFLVIATNSTQPAPVDSTVFDNLAQYSVGGITIVVFEMLVLALLAYWVLDWTPVGRKLYATGGNTEAARLSGIRVDRIAWGSLIVSGGIAGISGVLFSSLYGPSLSFGPTLLLPAFAAAFLGSTQLQPGRFNVWGTLIAIYVLATGVEGLQLVSGQQWLSNMFNGVALVAAVALAVSRERRDGSRKVRDTHRGSAAAELEGFEEGPSTALESVEGFVTDPGTAAVVGADRERGAHHR